MKTKRKASSSSYVDYLPFYGVLIVFLAIFNIFDAFSTAIIVGTGSGTELNPVMDWLIQKSMYLFIAFKLVIGALLFPKFWSIAQERLKITYVTIWALFVMYLLIVINNGLGLGVLLYRLL